MSTSITRIRIILAALACTAGIAAAIPATSTASIFGDAGVPGQTAPYNEFQQRLNPNLNNWISSVTSGYQELGVCGGVVFC